MAPKYQNPAHIVLDPGKNFTAEATGAIPGSRFVAFAPGGRPGRPVVKLADADDVVVGVSKYDIADGDTGGIFARAAGQITVTTGAAVTAGQGVVSDATGRAVPAGAGITPVAAAFTGGATNSTVYVQSV